MNPTKAKAELPYEEAAEPAMPADVAGLWKCKTCRRLFRHEHDARYCCAATMPCDCGGRREKYWTVCAACREEAAIKRYAELPRVPWDGVSLLCMDGTDTYFQSIDEIVDYIYEHPEYTLESLRLRICEPKRPRPFEMVDHIHDNYPEDWEQPDASAVEAAVNDWIEANVPTLWYPGKTAPTLESIACDWEEAQREGKENLES